MCGRFSGVRAWKIHHFENLRIYWQHVLNKLEPAVQ
jgi:hypothetical protein